MPWVKVYKGVYNGWQFTFIASARASLRADGPPPPDAAFLPAPAAFPCPLARASARTGRGTLRHQDENDSHFRAMLWRSRPQHQLRTHALQHRNAPSKQPVGLRWPRSTRQRKARYHVRSHRRHDGSPIRRRFEPILGISVYASAKAPDIRLRRADSKQNKMDRRSRGRRRTPLCRR
jgi:hypothetical protein